MTGGPSPAVAAFYDRWADLYAVLARAAPGIRGFRRRAVDELGLVSGDVAIDMGCGPGPNLPLLADAVGPSGRVVGIDVSTAMLDRADRGGDPAVDLVRADASRPPVDGPVDGVISTFVVTLFPDPDRVVRRWWDLLEPGGRLALLNVAPARGPFAEVLNVGLEVGLFVSTPTRSAYDESLVEVLRGRIDRAHTALSDAADRVVYHDAADGMVRLAVGTRRPA